VVSRRYENRKPKLPGNNRRRGPNEWSVRSYTCTGHAVARLSRGTANDNQSRKKKTCACACANDAVHKNGTCTTRRGKRC